MLYDHIMMFYVFALGTIIGSFLNVVLYRTYSGRSIGGRSSCGSCGKTLQAIDLVPIVSFLFLRGRCRRCGSRISWQYPLVEALTGLLFLGSYMYARTSYELIGFIAFSIVAVLISVYDIKHTIIPDAWSIAVTIIACGLRIPHIMDGSATVLTVLVGGVSVAGSLWAVWFVSDGRWLGLGDVKLSFGLGILLGAFGAFMALWTACILGSLVGVTLIAWQRYKHRKHHVTLQTQLPFGPFMLLATVLILFGYISLPYLWTQLYII